MDCLEATSFVLGMIAAIAVQTLLFVIREKLGWHFKVKRGKVAIGEELENLCNQLIACVTNSTLTLSATQLWGVLLAKEELILSIPQYAEKWMKLNIIFPAVMLKDTNESDKASLLERLSNLKKT